MSIWLWLATATAAAGHILYGATIDDFGNGYYLVSAKQVSEYNPLEQYTITPADGHREEVHMADYRAGVVIRRGIVELSVSYISSPAAFSEVVAAVLSLVHLVDMSEVDEEYGGGYLVEYSQHRRMRLEDIHVYWKEGVRSAFPQWLLDIEDGPVCGVHREVDRIISSYYPLGTRVGYAVQYRDNDKQMMMYYDDDTLRRVCAGQSMDVADANGTLDEVRAVAAGGCLWMTPQYTSDTVNHAPPVHSAAAQFLADVLPDRVRMEETRHMTGSYGTLATWDTYDARTYNTDTMVDGWMDGDGGWMVDGW